MDNIIQTPIIKEVEQSFLDYSLSVITDRAIPAVEDGLKPVMRRILWCMLEKGYRNEKQYVKCAKPVGDCMGQYHPHGDSSIYGALVGASQPWNMRYPLIDFHGNNGSRDGDGPAAMRYTECRLSKIAEATLNNIKKKTVDWIPNFDETSEEPVYLPGLFPNLLCNGTTGIAVAMACSFAPHNLGEVMDAAIAYLQGSAQTSEELTKYIKGPDFPTGGLIINQNELKSIYTTGKGKARVRGEYKIEKNKNGTENLVFTSIPYKISKEDLTASIDALCEEGKLTGISEIRDESNKDGVRFVLTLQKNVNADVMASRLYELTDLETTFSVNMVALEQKTPKQMTLADVIKNYIEHQKDVFRRLNQYQKEQLDKQIHIYAGLCKALDDIDNIIQLIKQSKDKRDAQANLIKKYNFSSEQADAILGMTLSRLANMEKIAIQKSLNDSFKERAIILERLNNESVFTAYLTEQLTDFKNSFNDPRRTQITHIEQTKEEKEIAQIVPEDVVVVVTDAGNIKRVPAKSFKIQKRNGKGVKTQDDVTLATIDTNTIDVILAFTNKGRVYRIGVDQIPEGNSTARGVAIRTLVEMEAAESVVAVTSVARDKKAGEFVWFVTRNGLVKKTNISEYAGSKRKAGIQALTFREGDQLVNVWVGNNSEILLLTEKGMGIRFDGNSIGTTGRTSTGVQGIKLNDGDFIAVGLPVTPEGQIFIGYSDGSGKRCLVSEFTKQNRAGKGLKCGCTGKIVTGVSGINEDDNLFLSGDTGAICIKASDINLSGRMSSPVKVIKDTKLVTAVKI